LENKFLTGMEERINQLASLVFPEVREIRRHLHSYPELSFEEYQTSAYVQQVLLKHGIHFNLGWVKTGIIAHIEGKNPTKKIIALRADLDALPIAETNTTSYVSKNPGVMHACGHDVHTASMLGTAMILNELKNEWEGTVKIIFQPGEEKLPGGAKLMIEAGGLKNPDAELIIAQHVFPEMEAGKVGFRGGMYMASTDEIHLTVSGRGGHAALPHQYDYTTLAAAEFIYMAQQAFDRVKAETTQAVLAFGKIIANGATNVIPETVKLEGTLRTLDENFREKVHVLLQQEAEKIQVKHNCYLNLDIKKGYPVLMNHPDLTHFCMKMAQKFWGNEQVELLDIRMTAEDFAYYSQQIPACFYRLGTGNKSKGITAPVHTPSFDIEEQAMEKGCGFMAYLAVELLKAD
jgi:amidohydrolase